MELEGFGTSLLGKAIFVYAKPEEEWIPWEFISGNEYNCKILITAENSTFHCLEVENEWSVILRPTSPKDWSCLATILRGMGGSILLAFDGVSPRAPDSFTRFLDTIVQDSKYTITRIWLGTNIDIPAVPDAVFFPVQIQSDTTKIYDMLRCLPSRNGHDSWKAMSLPDWNAIVETTISSNLGIAMSDVGEKEWNLFWHKLADSVTSPKPVLFQKGFTWLRTAMVVIEKNKDIH